MIDETQLRREIEKMEEYLGREPSLVSPEDVIRTHRNVAIDVYDRVLEEHIHHLLVAKLGFVPSGNDEF